MYTLTVVCLCTPRGIDHLQCRVHIANSSVQSGIQQDRANIKWGPGVTYISTFTGTLHCTLHTERCT